MDNKKEIIWPASWEEELYANVVEVVSTNKKKITQKQYLESGKYPVIDQGQSHIGGYFNDDDKVVKANFPVVVFGDHTRAVKLVKCEFIPGADGIKVLQPKEFLEPKLQLYFTQFLAQKIKDKGYARHYQWLAKEKIGIPPSNEQLRIIAKIEELFSELDNGIESLKTAQEQLKVYRQSILKHAFEGKLTEQWRKDNPDKLESAELLLERIKKERETRYNQQLEDWKVAVKEWEENGKEGKKPSKPKSPNAPRVLSENESAKLNALPNGWRWVHLDNIGELYCGQSPSVAEVNQEGRGSIYVTGPEQWNGKKIEETKWTEFPKRLVPDGCVFITVKGAGVGKLFPGIACAIGRDVYAYKPEPVIDYKFIINNIQFGINKVIMQAQGDIPGLSKEHIMSHLIGLPSESEQEQINLKVDEVLSELQHLEDDTGTSLKKIELLRQSILKKAFSGLLVPQDPSDEPASELLKRIAEEKAAIESEAKAAKAAARKAKSKASTK